MQLTIYFQLSLFGKTSWERFLQMTGWTLEPCYPRSTPPMFQCLLLEDGREPEWCEGERLTSHGGSWMPNIGGRVPVTRPFQCFRMRASAKDRTPEAFRNSFGLPTDPFPTLLAGGVAPFAFWYEDDPAGGFVRFLTELECERLMGLPEGWTKYGADGEEIRAASRYKALGNAIALPCAEYIMAGIKEVLHDPV